MSSTLRVYWREYGTGKVGFEGGWSLSSLSFVQYRMKSIAEDYAGEIGANIQEDRDDGLHVIKTVGSRAVGRFYFMADGPEQIPLGEGWALVGAPGGLECLSFRCELPGRREAFLDWEKVPQDEIDRNHGNDEFGGYWEPVFTVTGEGYGPLHLSRESGNAHAVALMMSDAGDVRRVVDAIESQHPDW